MTKERQRKRKRLRAMKPLPPQLQLIKLPALAALHWTRMEQLFGVKPQYTRQESRQALHHLVAEGAIDQRDAEGLIEEITAGLL